MKLFCKISLILSAFVFIVSCSNDNDDSPQLTGEIQVGIQTIADNSNGRFLKAMLSDADAILVTVEKSDGSSTEYNRVEIDLYQVDGNYISQKITLPIGDYKITEFLVIDADDNIRYVTPLEGSSQAQNVSNPLPISFTIAKDEITALSVEVISTDNLSLEDFGLVGFDLSEIELFSFLINVSEKGNLDHLLNAQLEITSDTYSFSKELQAIANNSVVIKDGYSTYQITIRHDGYNEFSYSFSRDSLSQHYSTPIAIELAPVEAWSAGMDWVDSRDGEIYETVVIGDQVWMTQNLRATKYNDGTEIPNITNSVDWNNLTAPAYAWYDNDEATYKEQYGGLYNWYSVETGKLCPATWHIASQEEWNTLREYLGGFNIAGGKIKESGTDHWNAPNTDGTNESGFTGLPAGSRYNGDFSGIGDYGSWWSSTEMTTDDALRMAVSYNFAVFTHSQNFKNSGYSVRCIKD